MKENRGTIYAFGDYDTVYVPKDMTLEEAIEWYTKEYGEIEENEIDEVYYTNVTSEKQTTLLKTGRMT